MDRLDLNTLTHWGAILTAIVAIGTPIVAILGWFKPLVRWLRTLKAQPKPVPISSVPISFVPDDLHCHWAKGRLNDQPTTTVRGRWYVTNTSDSDVMILKARLGKHTARVPDVMTAHQLDDEGQIFGKYPVRSNQMTQIMAVLEFSPAIHRERKPIIADVIFTDNFANEHRVRTKFVYLGGPQPSTIVSSPQLKGRVG